MAIKIDSDKYQKELETIKKNIKDGVEYFQKNYDDFKKMYSFVCVSTVTDEDANALAQQGKGTAKFNVIEAFVSKLRAVFLEQEPSMNIVPSDTLSPFQISDTLLNTIDIIEAHIREALQGPESQNYKDQILKDELIGGWGVGKISTDYASSKSFEQKFIIESVYPLFAVFDPCAKERHKGDGEWCAEIVPMKKDEFEREFGEGAAKNITFRQGVDVFSWSYKANANVEIVNVVRYYKKKYIKKDIVLLSTGATMDFDRYNQMLELMDKTGYIEQPPTVIDKRKTTMTKICLYTCCEDKVLKYEETDFEMLPLVFFDGNSSMAEDGMHTGIRQICRSYLKNAVDAQRLKNYAGQTLIQSMENIMTHQIMMPRQALPAPKELQAPYLNNQKQSILLYEEFLDGDSAIRLSPPTPAPEKQISPIIMDVFMACDKLIQTELGDYDNQIAMQSQAMSGSAITKAAMQTNQAAQPWNRGFIAGLERMAQIMVNMIPKIWRTPRSIPIRMPDGRRSYAVINSPVNTVQTIQPAEQMQQGQLPQQGVAYIGKDGQYITMGPNQKPFTGQLQSGYPQQPQGMPQGQQMPQQGMPPQQQGMPPQGMPPGQLPMQQGQPQMQPGQQMQQPQDMQYQQQLQDYQQYASNEINKQMAVKMDYDPESMLVKVEPGPTVALQKQAAMQQIVAAMQTSPVINEYFGTDGAPILFDQIDFVGVERAKSGFDKFLQQKQQQMQQQSQMQQQQQMMLAQKSQAETQALAATAQAKAMEAQAKMKTVNDKEAHFVADYLQKDKEQDRQFKLDLGELAIKKQEADADVMNSRAELANEQVSQILKAEEIDAENARTQVDSAIKVSEHVNSLIQQNKESQTEQSLENQEAQENPE